MDVSFRALLLPQQKNQLFDKYSLLTQKHRNSLTIGNTIGDQYGKYEDSNIEKAERKDKEDS